MTMKYQKGNMNNLIYITYQSFPASTANSLQTITNLKYLIKKGLNVKLVFPLREKNSNENKRSLQNFYELKEEFEIVGTKHYLPFGKIKIFNKLFFLISHFLWSLFISINIHKYSNRIFTS